ncbi:tRNA uracil 4-sulfurtransferase ThiI [Paraferrimonas sp. SM1919]|uniref:tRNA uracil 4-sulfurtransferase ThiI n=1 Tax=Paraferrimonas sp. SM1919 TaxID=2662263 RepID=UPI0013D6B6D9|nr:tRNA uracil 4-sulfurtransferase ThiI [Paraferrimonas sp. SM1919]
MKFVVKLYPEITIKSKSVRLRFIKLLETSIRNVLRRIDEGVRVKRNWDSLEVNLASEDSSIRDELAEKLQCIPGIQAILEVKVFEFETLDDIYQLAQQHFADTIKDKTFCVRVKRKGKHEFNSLQVEQYVGGGLNQFTEAKGVKLKNPDVLLTLEIKENKLYLVTNQYPGLKGFPIASQEDVLSLMSGGFDSGVASFQMINKGCRTHYCFFNLGGNAHEIGVKQVAYYLWKRYGESHKVKFVSVPFEAVVQEILEKVDNGQMGVVLKRVMMRAATRVAERLNINALVTGESLGQVSSQTLTNLNVIDRSTDMLILRPLAAMDKQDIIDTAREIGTYEFAETMPEYCGVISKSPTIKADLKKIEIEEAKFSEDLIDNIIAQSKTIDIREIAEMAEEQVVDAETVQDVNNHDVILDIRSSEEQEAKPLVVEGHEVQWIPFFKLGSKFSELDQSKTYLLYCDRGVMSKLQALYLQDQGYQNVKVYRP